MRGRRAGGEKANPFGVRHLEAPNFFGSGVNGFWGDCRQLCRKFVASRERLAAAR